MKWDAIECLSYPCGVATIRKALSQTSKQSKQPSVCVQWRNSVHFGGGGNHNYDLMAKM